MAVMALLNVAAPAADAIRQMPASVARRRRERKMAPRMAVGAVFQDATPSAHRAQCSLEAATVVPQLVLMRLTSAAVPEPSPALARGMCDNWVRPGVGARIAYLRPRINV